MSKLIIDVSQHNGTIDWTKVKSNIDGAIIRCGYGDDISSQDDTQWSRNISECERLGIPRGAYLYSYADTEAHAKSELQHLLRLLSGHTFQLPIYLDCEEAGTSSYAPKACEIICEGLKAAGYTPGVYANTNWWTNYLISVTKYTRWVAQYNDKCTYSGDYDIWQYTSSGNIPGISGNVDVSQCYKDFSALISNKNDTKNTTTTANTTRTSSTASNNETDIIFTYAVQLVDGTILPAVTNLSDFAGIKGKAIANVAIKVNKGAIKYRVHVKGHKWLDYVTGFDWGDAANGYAGNGKAIDAIEIYYSTPENVIEKYGYQKAKYRVSALNGNYYDWQYDNEKTGGQDGYAGCLGVSMDRLQLCCA